MAGLAVLARAGRPRRTCVGGDWLTVAVPKQTSPATPPAPAAADAPRDANADVPTLSYEQARDELVAVVGRLETGAATLEESLALWERGEALAARCQQWLDGARDRLAAARGTSGDAEGAAASSTAAAAGRGASDRATAAAPGSAADDELDGPDGPEAER